MQFGYKFPHSSGFLDLRSQDELIKIHRFAKLDKESCGETAKNLLKYCAEIRGFFFSI